ncbi:MAG: hypothetical protein KDD94_11180 [Calditrichaeota bacterium]|nr:hypothetical protein [Calditrichota bacterium]
MSDYQSALDFLYSLQFHGIKLGLENPKRFLKYCGLDTPNAGIIHIAGTNGKGSTANFIQAIITAHGYKSGLFTSPHILDFRERIRVDGQLVSEQFVCDFVDQFGDYISDNHFTFFEVNTVMAIAYFEQENVDFMVLETGMGGRLDATNCFDETTAVITNIAMDHMEYLGDTIEAICAEKCGIIKENSSLFVSEQSEPLRKQIELVTKSNNSKVTWIDERSVDDSEMVRFKSDSFHNCLIGKHQNLNLLTALNVTDSLIGPLEKEKTQQAIDHMNWPGRLQFWQKNPSVILDVSHNLAGVKVTIDALLNRFAGKKFVILTALLADKQIAEIRQEFLRLTDSIFVYEINQHRYDQRLILEQFDRSFDKQMTMEKLKESESADYILVIGSHYLIEQFMRENQDL